MAKKERCRLKESDYVTIVITVPETHANAVREAMGRAGAGKVGSYSYCSYSVKGTGRFMPNKGSDPYIGTEGVIEEVIEERIETVCNRAILECVLEEIKNICKSANIILGMYF
jgi:hypothetical protein